MARFISFLKGGQSSEKGVRDPSGKKRWGILHQRKIRGKRRVKNGRGEPLGEENIERANYQSCYIDRKKPPLPSDRVEKLYDVGKVFRGCICVCGYKSVESVLHRLVFAFFSLLPAVNSWQHSKKKNEKRYEIKCLP